MCKGILYSKVVFSEEEIHPATEQWTVTSLQHSGQSPLSFLTASSLCTFKMSVIQAANSDLTVFWRTISASVDGQLYQCIQ